jgi:DNA modification methylase
MNQLILGDNLEVLKKLDSEIVDLIYLDPPFFSNRNYEVIWGDEGEVRSFVDRWSGGMDHYIAWLKERVEQMHRILKPTGSIFLHCDWHADAYIRVEILDKIFSTHNFINHIVWRRTTPKGLAFTRLARNYDSIFWYSKTSEYTWNPVYKPYDKTKVDEQYSLIDENGRRFQMTSLLNPNPDRPNLTYEFLGHTRVWRWTKDRMDEAYKNGLIIIPKGGKGIPRFKRYLDEQEGVPVDNFWEDISNVQSSNEKIGYPTQKPQVLIKRIIEMTSNEEDLVLDPFVGGGTTIAVADKLNRRWIGIDQSVQAIKVSEFRLNQQQDLFSQPFTVHLHKYDYDTLRNKPAFQFESWIIQQFGGTSNSKQRNDYGLDGKYTDNTPIQVKRSDNIGRNVIDNFLSAVQRSDKKLFETNKAAGKPVGYILAFSFGKGAIQEAARLKNHEEVIIKLVEVKDIVPIAKKPTVQINIEESGRDKKGIRELNLTATAHSEAGIEFYSWDFNYKPDYGFKPEVIIDKEGHQTQKFKPGSHTIAVKAVDNDGLDSLEVIRLKINGIIEMN